jgi:hypothetical protein
MEKGWREGKGNVIERGEVDDMGEQGSWSLAHADFVWFVVGKPSDGERWWPTC